MHLTWAVQARRENEMESNTFCSKLKNYFWSYVNQRILDSLKSQIDETISLDFRSYGKLLISYGEVAMGLR